MVTELQAMVVELTATLVQLLESAVLAMVAPT